jgi:nucleotide-binding universal stress UspA family protein
MHQESEFSIGSIVFATDFLENSRLALDYAVAFCHRYGAKLTLMHAFELSPEAQEVEMRAHKASVSRLYVLSRLEALAAGTRRLGIDTGIDLREGEPCTSALSSVAANNADLLVLGTHGIYKGVEHVFIGSNAEKILLSAPCPTLTVGRYVMAGVDLDLSFRQILHVSDTSPESAIASGYAASLGQDLRLEVETISVSPGDAASNSQKVIERATTCADGLLVLGVHNESAWKRHMHASFAFELVAKSACPVLTVPCSFNPKLGVDRQSARTHHTRQP